MEKPQEELIEEGSALFGGFEGLLEKLPFQASTLRLIKAKQIKMSDKLRGDIERLIEGRKVAVVPDAPPAAIVEDVPVPATPLLAEEAKPTVPASVTVAALNGKGEVPEVDHPEAVAALFDEPTLMRLSRLATASRLSPAQLVRVGTLRYMDQIEKTGEIIIRFNPKDNP